MTDTQTTGHSYYVAAQVNLRKAQELADSAKRRLSSADERYRREGEALRGLADSYTALSRQALSLARFEIEHPEDTTGT
jgi:hypothetical protein